MMDALRGKVTPKDWMAVGAMLAIIAGVIVVYIFFVHRGMAQNYDELTTEDKAVLADIAEAKRKQAGIAKLREETEKTRTLVSSFEKRLPSERDIPDMVRQFEILANEVGLKHAMKPEQRISDERKETIPYSVSTFGSFHQTASFINKLERYERYIKISNLKVEEEDNGVSKATFTLSTYRFLATAAPTKQAAQTASTPAAAPQPGGKS
ncbi:MAG: type 4a pilus biogenesis protein PilO [Candidatus Hydrogenedentes bacterium]|nr:type 4a pilus biogenesis protein PilO [Candidatus Hydrogenedentota bacterium]